MYVYLHDLTWSDDVTYHQHEHPYGTSLQMADLGLQSQKCWSVAVVLAVVFLRRYKTFGLNICPVYDKYGYVCILSMYNMCSYIANQIIDFKSIT